MNKTLLRFVALLLVPCILADPATAAVCAYFGDISRVSVSSLSDRAYFEQQALADNPLAIQGNHRILHKGHVAIFGSLLVAYVLSMTASTAAQALTVSSEPIAFSIWKHYGMYFPIAVVTSWVALLGALFFSRIQMPLLATENQGTGRSPNTPANVSPPPVSTITVTRNLSRGVRRLRGQSPVIRWESQLRQLAPGRATLADVLRDLKPVFKTARARNLQVVIYANGEIVSPDDIRELPDHATVLVTLEGESAAEVDAGISAYPRFSPESVRYIRTGKELRKTLLAWSSWARAQETGFLRLVVQVYNMDLQPDIPERVFTAPLAKTSSVDWVWRDIRSYVSSFGEPVTLEYSYDLSAGKREILIAIVVAPSILPSAAPRFRTSRGFSAFWLIPAVMLPLSWAGVHFGIPFVQNHPAFWEQMGSVVSLLLFAASLASAVAGAAFFAILLQLPQLAPPDSGAGNRKESPAVSTNILQRLARKAVSDVTRPYSGALSRTLFLDYQDLLEHEFTQAIRKGKGQLEQSTAEQFAFNFGVQGAKPQRAFINSIKRTLSSAQETWRTLSPEARAEAIHALETEPLAPPSSHALPVGEIPGVNLAIQPDINLLKNTSEVSSRRIQAAAALGNSHHPAALQSLLTVLESYIYDREVRVAVIRALANGLAATPTSSLHAKAIKIFRDKLTHDAYYGARVAAANALEVLHWEAQTSEEQAAYALARQDFQESVRLGDATLDILAKGFGANWLIRKNMDPHIQLIEAIGKDPTLRPKSIAVLIQIRNKANSLGFERIVRGMESGIFRLQLLDKSSDASTFKTDQGISLSELLLALAVLASAALIGIPYFLEHPAVWQQVVSRIPFLSGALAAVLSWTMFRGIRQRMMSDLRTLSPAAVSKLEAFGGRRIREGAIGGYLAVYSFITLGLDFTHPPAPDLLAVYLFTIALASFVFLTAYQSLRQPIPTSIEVFDAKTPVLFSEANIAGLSPAQIFDTPGIAAAGQGALRNETGIGSGVHYDLMDPQWGRGRWWYVAEPRVVSSGWVWGKVLGIVQDILEFNADGVLERVVRLYKGDAEAAISRRDMRLNWIGRRLARAAQMSLIVPAVPIIDGIVSLRAAEAYYLMKDAGEVPGAPEYRYMLDQDLADERVRRLPNTPGAPYPKTKYLLLAA